MSHEYLASLEIEDLTPRQLRKVLNGFARSKLPYAQKNKEEQEEDKERANKESEALTDLHREKKGDPKAPPVLESDLPNKVVKRDDEDEDDDDDKKTTKNKKRIA